MEAVGPLAADLDGRCRRDRQLDLAAEARERASSSPRRGGSPPLERLAFRVARRRPRGEVDLRQIPLRQPDEARCRLRRPAGQQHEQAGRERIERSGVPRLRAASASRTPASTANDDGPAGLSTRITPVGSRPLGIAISLARAVQASAHREGRELGHDERRDLLDREVAREPCRLPVATAARLARDRRDIDAIGRGAQRDLPRRAALARGLADQRGELGPLDGAQDVDDAFRVRLHRADLGEVGRGRGTRRRPGHPRRGQRGRALERAASAWRTPSIRRRPRTPAGDRRLLRAASAASRNAAGVVFAYWNRPVSVTRPVYSASAIEGVRATRSSEKTSASTSAVDDASATTRFAVPKPRVVVMVVDVDDHRAAREPLVGQPRLLGTVHGDEDPIGRVRRNLAQKPVVGELEERVLARAAAPRWRAP